MNSGSLAMLWLDIMSVMPYLKSYWQVFVGVAMAIAVGGDSLLLYIIPTMLLYWMAVNIFSIEEKNHLETLHDSLPLTEGTAVLGRYLFFLVHGLLGIVLGGMTSAGIALVLGSGFNVGAFLAGTPVSMAMLFLLSSIQLPLNYRFGFVHPYFNAMMPILLLASCTPLLKSIFPGLRDVLTAAIGVITQNAAFSAVLALTVSGILYLVSVPISLKMRRRSRQGYAASPRIYSIRNLLPKG